MIFTFAPISPETGYQRNEPLPARRITNWREWGSPSPFGNHHSILFSTLRQNTAPHRLAHINRKPNDGKNHHCFRDFTCSSLPLLFRPGTPARSREDGQPNVTNEMTISTTPPFRPADFVFQVIYSLQRFLRVNACSIRSLGSREDTKSDQ
jgi:hypothetical protein